MLQVKTSLSQLYKSSEQIRFNKCVSFVVKIHQICMSKGIKVQLKIQLTTPEHCKSRKLTTFRHKTTVDSPYPVLTFRRRFD